MQQLAIYMQHDEFDYEGMNGVSLYDQRWLTRFQVIDNELVRFRAHCFEESTLETQFAQKPKTKTVLSGLLDT